MVKEEQFISFLQIIKRIEELEQKVKELEKMKTYCHDHLYDYMEGSIKFIF